MYFRESHITLNSTNLLTNVCIFKQNQHFKQWQISEFSLITFFLLLMRLLVLHGVADGFVVW